jgi:hypothetical protein
LLRCALGGHTSVQQKDKPERLVIAYHDENCLRDLTAALSIIGLGFASGEEAIASLEVQMSNVAPEFQKSLMEDEKIDKEEVWSAIRYLDPDKKEKDEEANIATIIAVLALVLIFGGVWVVLWFRLRRL